MHGNAAGLKEMLSNASATALRLTDYFMSTKTGCKVPRFDFLPYRFLPLANFAASRASGVEFASLGRVYGTGNIALNGLQLPAPFVYRRDRID